LGIHGTADLQNPYLGHGQPYWTYSVPEAARRWGTSDGCGPTPEVVRVSAGTTRTAYHDCRAGADVVLYTLTGRGHVWPTARTGFDSDETVWSFFVAHPGRASDRAPKPD
jgi:polyhydroxybutyrate depolymerase